MAVFLRIQPFFIWYCVTIRSQFGFSHTFFVCDVWKIFHSFSAGRTVMYPNTGYPPTGYYYIRSTGQCQEMFCKMKLNINMADA